MKLASCKSALTRPSPTPLRPIVYSTDHSKAVVRCWSNSLMLCGLFYEAICLFYEAILPCVIYFVLVFFSPFSIAITSLGEERADLSAFRSFVRFVLVWFC